MVLVRRKPGRVVVDAIDQSIEVGQADKHGGRARPVSVSWSKADPDRAFDHCRIKVSVRVEDEGVVVNCCRCHPAALTHTSAHVNGVVGDRVFLQR